MNLQNSPRALWYIIIVTPPKKKKKKKKEREKEREKTINGYYLYYLYRTLHIARFSSTLRAFSYN